MKNKVRMSILVTATLLMVVGTAVGFGRQMWKGQVSGTQALAAEETVEREPAEETKNAVEFRTMDANRVFEETECGSLLQLAAYKIEIGKFETGEVTEEDVYEEISTRALAQEALDTLEQETLQLMSLPAGAVWGGRMKVYAGQTPLIITEEDKEVLLRIVEAEATSEDIKGRMLVANVVLNRVVSDRFPDSIPEVVFQNNGETYQFAPIKDGRYWSVTVSEETIEAVDRVLAGEDLSQGALFFAARSMARKSAMRWFDTSLQYLFRHGVHEFFTYK